MDDYKNLYKSIKHLQKDINKAFKKLEIKEYKLYFPKKKNLFDLNLLNIINNFFKISYITKIILFFIVFSLLFSVIYSIQMKSFNKKNNNKIMPISYIGKIKIDQEIAKMTNFVAMGGAEIKEYDSNKSELKFFFYKIKQGESLFTISKKLGVSMDTLISLNSMNNAHNLSAGNRIVVPNLDGILYNVKKNDTLESISKKYKVSIDDILNANDLENITNNDFTIQEGFILFLPGARLTEEERAKVLGYHFQKPLHGLFTSGFGLRRDPFTGELGYHTGIDIAAGYGLNVKAAKEGRVVFAGWYSGYGKCVIVKHQFGYETLYAHLSSISVKEGTYVKAGQTIGRVGSTGRSTGSHLHFEVRRYGRPINPVRLSGLFKRGKFY